ncbi:unnamed protein product [Withania somnifera]
MAAFELLYQARRHCLYKSKSHFSPLLRSHFHRFLSTENPNRPDSNTGDRNDAPEISPVSYTPKTRPESEIRDEGGMWTREDLRYLKDAPKITPVSYPTRVVAPLPEDLNVEEEEKRRTIEAQKQRVIRRVLNVEEEKMPFPSLINVKSDEEKKKKVVYDLKEAIRHVKANAKKKFDETLEAHVVLTSDMRRSDLKLEGTVAVPHGFGKVYRIAVFAEGAAADEAREAGADVVGGLELIENIRSGNVKIDFDKCFSTHAMMPNLRQIAKYLRQLMPDTKKGTVTKDIAKAVKEAKQGVPFKKDKTAIVHVGIGKVSFQEDALCENIGAFVHELLRQKPAGLKKSSKYAGYVNTVHLCSTMGPSFPVTIQSLSIAADRHAKKYVH